MTASKSILARLLAKENITVRSGNYTTAFFDVKNRVLGLPAWKDDNKDLHDMLVGHEVGHALYTPAEGWGSMSEASGDERVPMDYLNVVEDIRIERMIQDQYPGLGRVFKKGYSYLSESDFFGIGDRDVNKMGLMDRINLKAKLRDLIDVEFSSAELPLVNKAFAASTWDEVVESARELYDYVKENPQDKDTETVNREPNKNQSSDNNNDNSESPIDPTPRSSDSETDEQSQEEETSNDTQNDSQDAQQSQDSPDDQKSEETTSSDTGGSEGSLSSPEEVETHRNATKNASDLLEKTDDGRIPCFVYGFTRQQMKEITVPFDDVYNARLEALAKYVSRLKGSTSLTPKEVENHLNNQNTDQQYKEFVSETKRVVNVLAKEFELRKAAHQYSRASVSRSGSLDLQRLHEYKTSDDIFKRVTTLADAKSHGMVMLIDNSASMYDAIGPVISQVLTMAMFCKRVNIPFDVYSFTARTVDNQMDLGEDYEHPEDSIRHTSTLLTHVLSSSFSRKTYDVAYRQLFDISCGKKGSKGVYDVMSGTPLDNILSGMHMILNDFRKKHQLEKTIFTVLSDGESAQVSVSRGLFRKALDEGFSTSHGRIILAESRRTVEVGNLSFPLSNNTARLLNAIKKEVPGLVNVGYFVANSPDEFRYAVYDAIPRCDDDTFREARKIANRDKFYSLDNVIGFDRYFILKGDRASNLQAKDDEFKVSDKAKRAEITREFKKYTKSKKGNRVMATQLAEIIS